MDVCHAKNISHQVERPDEKPFVVREFDDDWYVVGAFEDPKVLQKDDPDLDAEAATRRVRHRPKPPWHSD